MASSVKVSKLIENYDLKLCNPGIDTDKIKITVPDINRPSLEWTGYFEHFDSLRVQIIGFTENSYVEQMDKESKFAIYEKLMSQRFPCIVFCRGMEPDQELIDAGTKYGVPVLVIILYGGNHPLAECGTCTMHLYSRCSGRCIR